MSVGSFGPLISSFFPQDVHPIGPWLGMLRIASWVRLGIIWPVNEKEPVLLLDAPIIRIRFVSSRRRGLPPGTRIFFGDQNSCDGEDVAFWLASLCAPLQPSEAAQLHCCHLTLVRLPWNFTTTSPQMPLVQQLAKRGLPAEISNGSRRSTAARILQFWVES